MQKELDDIFHSFKESYSSKNWLYASVLNEYHYFDKLQIIKPTDIRVENYLKELNTIINGDPLSSLLFFYVKNRVDKFNYNDLNTINYSQNYIKLLAIGTFIFLRHEDYKGDKQYQKTVDWLKTTELYKNDSIYIKKEITPISNEIFKDKLKDLILKDIKNVKTDLNLIIKENPSNYYLIDFWATWCTPCIQGVKTMNKMQLPKNVKVVSISVDKEKDKQKWVKRTKELKQSITIWLDETNENNKKFTEFIEMQSIPRYILIDKDMNLIDQAFYHPQEPQFLPKLQDVKNYKYW